MTPKVSPGAEQGYVVNKRGQRIYTEVFLAPQGVKQSAVLCWEHGLGEHVGRYEKGALRTSCLEEGQMVCHRIDALLSNWS